MTEFKKGQKLRRTEDAGLTTARVGEIYTFDEYEPGRELRWLALAEFPAGVAGDRWPFSARAFELVEEEVKTETTTEEVEVIITALLPGDVVIRKADHPNYLAVRREVPVPPKPAQAQFGAALVDGVSVRGFLANAGESFVFPLPAGGYHEVGAGAFDDFEPDALPALPTREALAAEFVKGKEAAFEAVEKVDLWGPVGKAYWEKSRDGLWHSGALDAARHALVKAARADASTEPAS